MRPRRTELCCPTQAGHVGGGFAGGTTGWVAESPAGDAGRYLLFNVSDFGAHPDVVDGVAGTRFGVSAPNAKEVSVVCNANGWQPGRNWLHGSDSGIWSGFIPGVGHGDMYKYVLRTWDGRSSKNPIPTRFMQKSPEIRVRRLPTAGISLAGQRLDAQAAGNQLVRTADRHLRGAPRVLEKADRWPAIFQLPRTGPHAGRIRPRDGLHAPAVDADLRVSLRRLLGLPDDRLFR